MSLLQMSLSASAFIVAVVFFRFLLLHKIPKIAFMLLWCVALFRLLVPVSFHSQWSAFTVINYVVERFTVQAIIPAADHTSSVNGESLLMPPITDHIAMPAVPLHTASSVSPFVWLWLVGFTLCALYFIIPHVRSRHHYRMSLPVKHDFIQQWQQSNPLWRKVQIRQSEGVMTPLTYGILQPVILLPKGMDYTDERQLALILAHEYIHIRRLDTLKKWLLAASLCLHWFNPLVWVMYVLANRDIELSCDEKVIKISGDSMKSAYAMALVHLEEKKSGLSPLTSAFAKNPIEERIISIMKMRKNSIAASLLAVVIVVGAVAVFATSALDNTEAAASIDKTTAESALASYQGEASTALMPLDLTFTQSDVPMLIDQLNASAYRAVYIDDKIYLRVTNDNAIQISKDSGGIWHTYDTERIDAKQFANWLLANDPNPGYSIKEMQSRLAGGAEVEHLVLEDGKEMYIVIDGTGVQIVLVQPVKLASVLLDGQRMMITSVRHPMPISAQMLQSFYDLLVASSILTAAQAEQDYSERINHLKENDTYFTVVK